MQTGFRLLSHLWWNDVLSEQYACFLQFFLNSAKLNTSNGSSVTCVCRVKKWPKKVEKFFEKSLVVKKKGVPLQSLSETGVRQEPQGGRKNKSIDTSDKIFGWMRRGRLRKEGVTFW